jgi:hypothetical protein
MFDVSFGEVLVVITAASVLLGKYEITTGARLIGKGERLGLRLGLGLGVKVRIKIRARLTLLSTLT